MYTSPWVVSQPFDESGSHFTSAFVDAGCHGFQAKFCFHADAADVAWVQSVVTVHTEHLKVATEAAASAEAALSAAHAPLAASLDALSERLQQFAERQSVDAAEALASTQALLDTGERYRLGHSLKHTAECCFVCCCRYEWRLSVLTAYLHVHCVSLIL